MKWYAIPKSLSMPPFVPLKKSFGGLVNNFAVLHTASVAREAHALQSGTLAASRFWRLLARIEKSHHFAVKHSGRKAAHVGGVALSCCTASPNGPSECGLHMSHAALDEVLQY